MGQRKISEERDTKTENTFNTLHEEEEPSPIGKIDKDEKKGN